MEVVLFDSGQYAYSHVNDHVFDGISQDLASVISLSSTSLVFYFNMANEELSLRIGLTCFTPCMKEVFEL